jgi:hypothetical protein
MIYNYNCYILNSNYNPYITQASTIVDKYLFVMYRGHPQKDQIKVHGEIFFPNLKFESTDINFGCVLNDTSKHINIKITNSSSVKVAYEWIFVETIEQTGEQMYICMHMEMYGFMFTFRHICIYEYKHIDLYTYVYKYTYMYTYIYIHMYIYVCVYVCKYINLLI